MKKFSALKTSHPKPFVKAGQARGLVLSIGLLVSTACDDDFSSTDDTATLDDDTTSSGHTTSRPPTSSLVAPSSPTFTNASELLTDPTPGASEDNSMSADEDAGAPKPMPPIDGPNPDEMPRPACGGKMQTCDASSPDADAAHNEPPAPEGDAASPMMPPAPGDDHAPPTPPGMPPATDADGSAPPPAPEGDCGEEGEHCCAGRKGCGDKLRCDNPNGPALDDSICVR